MPDLSRMIGRAQRAGREMNRGARITLDFLRGRAADLIVSLGDDDDFEPLSVSDRSAKVRVTLSPRFTANDASVATSFGFRGKLWAIVADGGRVFSNLGASQTVLFTGNPVGPYGATAAVTFGILGQDGFAILGQDDSRIAGQG